MSFSTSHLRRYKLIKEIGSGTFGRVWMAKDLENDEFIAIKRRPKWQNMLSREIEAMECVKSKEGITQIKDSFYTVTPGGIIMQNIVMPLMSKSLGSFLREQRMLRKINHNHRISTKQIKSISFQIVKGLSALHSLGYTHRDLKPDNILLNLTNNNEDCVVNICDLGSSKKITNIRINMPYVVSRYYRAPELLLGSCNYDQKIDIWALGCIFAELFTLDPVFVGRCPDKLRNRLPSNKQGLDEPFQILRIIEVLGNPNSEDINALVNLIPNSIARSCSFSFLNSGVAPISWVELLEGFYTEEERILVELISDCIQWNPKKRPTVCMLFVAACRYQKMDLNNFNILDVSSDKREMSIHKLFRDLGEAMARIKELVEIDSAAKMIECSNRVEYEMERYQKELNDKDNSKMARDILQLETSRIEGELESMKSEYMKLNNSISILRGEKRRLEIESMELKSRYRCISESLNDTLIKIANKNEEIEKYRRINDDVKKEIEDLELAITLEESDIIEKKKILRNLEIDQETKELELKKSMACISEVAKDFDVKVKMKKLIENNINPGKCNTIIQTVNYGNKLSKLGKKHQYKLSFNLRKTISNDICEAKK
ncbi:kinase domain-containing [Cryptosporidium xiaoi]|uniref:Kinase domain-containing n=1 Tax=Cryptosporidium xiaoi TaxID=659607 RepID=A0AAV9YBJ4_9CRYT